MDACTPHDLPHGNHDWLYGQCARCGAVMPRSNELRAMISAMRNPGATYWNPKAADAMEAMMMRLDQVGLIE